MILNIRKQVETGCLVCPKTKRRLVYYADKQLQTDDGQHIYECLNGVPILLDKEAIAKYLRNNSGSMRQEYEKLIRPNLRTKISAFFYNLALIGGDYRTRESRLAFEQVVVNRSSDHLCLSIGGGPTRKHPNLTNLNIGLFQNVDVVGDAYQLPYSDNCVDSIYCEAVIEHLETPERAVAEMYRVLKPGGLLFSSTPFLQRFHAYPDHYQNLTLIGHERIYTRAGFTIESSGPCVGPIFMLTDLLASFFECLMKPHWVARVISYSLRVVLCLVRPLDLILNRHHLSHMLSSSTFVRGTKN